MSIGYAGGVRKGDLVQDTVAFTNHSEMRADNFNFYITYGQQKPNEGSDAVLGLAPHDDTSGPLLLEHMYLQGNVPE